MVEQPQNPSYNRKLIPKAKELRNEPTTPERILWQHLRRSQTQGQKFRRQQPIGPFIADFYCHEMQLVIELDGDSHEDKEEYDERRQQYLESRGLTVMRFVNNDIWTNLAGVLQTIYDFCEDRLKE